ESLEKKEEIKKEKKETNPFDPIAFIWAIISLGTIICTIILFVFLENVVSDQSKAKNLNEHLNKSKAEKWQTTVFKLSQIKKLNVNFTELTSNLADADFCFINISDTVFYVIYNSKLLFRRNLSDFLKKLESTNVKEDRKIIDPFISYCFLSLYIKLPVFLIQLRGNEVFINNNLVSQKTSGITGLLHGLLKD
ncbi:hypothetical protein TUBRATIS_22370, partial [Tubulinosema ratisbonensis]